MSSRMLRVRNTFCTSPGPLYMWKMGPSLVTMPAASWPRCCSSRSPSYRSWLTGVWATTPTMPHIFLYAFLSADLGNVRPWRE